MTPTFTSCGKQVLRDGKDFAQGSSIEAAEAICAALASRAAPNLKRDVLATGLRALSVLTTEIAASMNNPAQGALRKTFVDAAILTFDAAKELSDG
ncbi:hypothetical protein [Sphingomonas sp. HMP6]|uniref:hypothetical protein n=1 Tax=Sphingomonas sp. HMP6 TaxID=1517551 RepID=UPI0015968ACB|nr:hypothetical protein [Sphingomonas sp. HMP6]BCA57732.1 hypothetical protein HMP06_0501 [Sphingomonas sp. HMP6]